MHRVELKVCRRKVMLVAKTLVPNAPCGVERVHLLSGAEDKVLVPNAPCGVERLLTGFSLSPR